MSGTIATERLDRCALCGAGERRTVHERQPDMLYGTPWRWDVHECAGCGTGYLDPRPTRDDIGRVYESYYTHHAAEPPRHRLSLPRRVMNWLREGYLGRAYGYPSSRLQRLAGPLLHLDPVRREDTAFSVMYLPHLESGRLLEIGCGSGDFLIAMKEKGWRVEGMDVDAAAAEVARQRSGVTVRVGSLGELGYPEASFDAITMCHVIEHVHDPVELLTECARLLAPGGRLVLVTPNWRSLGHRLFGARWPGIDAPRHLQIFTAESITDAIQRAGMIVEDLRLTIRGGDYMWKWRHGNPRAGNDGGARTPTPQQRRGAAWFQRFEWVSSFAMRDAGEELLVIAGPGER